MKKKVINVSLILGFGILCFIFLVVTLSSIAFLFGGRALPIWTILSLVISCGIVYVMLHRVAVNKPLLWLAVFLSIIVGAVAVASATLDSSWDGDSYHKTAVGELANGWNPIYQDINSFNKSNANPFKLIGDFGLDRGFDTPWVNHYPKASWIFGANIYKITGNIESGKAITPLVMISLFLLAFGYFYQKLERNKAVLIALLLTFNPITVSQLNSYYLDGTMGNLLIILLLALTMIMDRKAKIPFKQLTLYCTIFISSALAMNLKYTGLAYVGVIMACYCAYQLVCRNWQTFIRLSGIGLASLVFGILVIGASSYVKNTLVNSSPLYPLAGKGSINLLAGEEPVGYAHDTNLVRFIKANLAPTSQVNYNESLKYGAPRPKIPFSISMSELPILGEVDIRQGGYGVWFGGILIVSSISTAYLLIRYGRRDRKYLPVLLLPLVVIAVCVIGIEGTWWARYLPFLPIFPIIVVIALYLKKHTVLPNILVFAMLFNVTLTALISSTYQESFQHLASQNLSKYLPCSSKPTLVYSSAGLDGELYNLRDKCHNIDPITKSKFDTFPSSNRLQLFDGIYVIR